MSRPDAGGITRRDPLGTISLFDYQNALSGCFAQNARNEIGVGLIEVIHSV